MTPILPNNPTFLLLYYKFLHCIDKHIKTKTIECVDIFNLSLLFLPVSLVWIMTYCTYYCRVCCVVNSLYFSKHHQQQYYCNNSLYNFFFFGTVLYLYYATYGTSRNEWLQHQVKKGCWMILYCSSCSCFHICMFILFYLDLSWYCHFLSLSPT